MEQADLLVCFERGNLMVRYVLPMLSIACLLVAGPANAQEWARKMFEETEHDFGVVARGAPTEYRFSFQNIYKEDIHVAGVRSSCGCTSPSISKQSLKTWEKSDIICRYNTHSFLGAKGATVTVTIDRPFFAEVQLQVKGHIRSDVVFDPNLVNFGSVAANDSASKQVSISYLGRSNWTIKDVRSANPSLGVRLRETERTNGKVTYEMQVILKPGAETGYFQDSLTIITDDASNPRVTLPVQGRVESSSLVSISPALVSFGAVQMGDSANERLIVRAKQPFKISGLKSSSPLISFGKYSSEAKALHLVPVEFSAAAAGDLAGTITIDTDLGAASCDVSATVQ